MPASVKARGVQEWIMFIVAIGVVVYFAASGTELSVGWLLLIGSMLGFSMLVAGVQRSLGMGGPDPVAAPVPNVVRVADPTPTVTKNEEPSRSVADVEDLSDEQRERFQTWLREQETDG